MDSVHSWRWLCSESEGRARRALDDHNAAPTRRPCLPAIEQLDDRILLSGTAPAAVTTPPPPTLGDELRVIIKDVVALGEAQTGFIKTAITDYKEKILTSNDVADLIKIGGDFYKLDQVLYKESIDLLTHKLTADEARADAALITQDLNDITTLSKELSANAQTDLLPAVQKVTQAATTFEGDLLKLGGFSNPTTGGVTVTTTGDTIA